MNFASSIGGQFITLLMQFIVRTVFIATLGTSYLGISSLFSNILSMLSLAELGVGSAILFKLYKPIAEENHHRIALLMKFYKRIYQAIGIATGETPAADPVPAEPDQELRQARSAAHQRGSGFRPVPVQVRGLVLLLRLQERDHQGASEGVCGLARPVRIPYHLEHRSDRLPICQ